MYEVFSLIVVWVPRRTLDRMLACCRCVGKVAVLVGDDEQCFRISDSGLSAIVERAIVSPADTSCENGGILSSSPNPAVVSTGETPLVHGKAGTDKRRDGFFQGNQPQATCTNSAAQTAGRMKKPSHVRQCDVRFLPDEIRATEVDNSSSYYLG